jgi:hypothetical protein
MIFDHIKLYISGIPKTSISFADSLIEIITAIIDIKKAAVNFNISIISTETPLYYNYATHS